MIRTVLGDIKKEELGVTTAHEHVYSDLRPLVDDMPDNPEFNSLLTVDKRYLVNEDPYFVKDNAYLRAEDSLIDMQVFHKFGGRALVEMTTDDFGRDPVVLKDLSQKSGLHVVMGCGHYIDASISEKDKNKTVDQLAKEIIDDINVGVRGTGIKAGVIGEVGTSMEITDVEWKNVRAAAIASAETGAAISFHTALWGRNASAIIKEVTSFGVKPEKICIGHIDVALRPDYLYEIVDQGAYVEYDNIGKEFYVPKDNQGLLHGRFAYDLERAESILDLVKRGNADRILLSIDICLRSMQIVNGGNGYVHLLRHFKPMLKDMGISQRDIDKMFIDNPANFLDINK